MLRSSLLVLALLLPSAAAAQKLEDDSPPPAKSGAVTLDIDVGALRAEERCVGMIASGQTVAAEACLQRVIESAPESTAALRAKASLEALRASRAANASSGFATAPPAFPPGRLPLVLASGLFGIWNGTAPALFLAAQSNIPAFFSAAGGGGAVLLGGGFSLAAYLLSEALEPTPGTSLLLASGMAWGIGLGVAVSPWVFAAAGSPWEDGSLLPPNDFERGYPAAAAVSALTGYVGLAVASGLALTLDFDEGQVGTANTGAGVGLVAGMAMVPLLDALDLANPGTIGLAFLASSALGLAGGVGMSRMVHLDVWEVLVIDLVTVSAAAGTGVAAFFLTQAAPAPVGGLASTAVVVFGTGAALIGSTGVLGWLRVQRGEQFSRLGLIPFDLVFGAPEVVLDRSGEFVPIMPLVAGRF